MMERKRDTGGATKDLVMEQINESARGVGNGAADTPGGTPRFRGK